MKPIDVPANQTSVAAMQTALDAQATALESSLSDDLAALVALSTTFAAAGDLAELEPAAQALGAAWFELSQKVALEADLARRRLHQATRGARNLADASADLA